MIEKLSYRITKYRYEFLPVIHFKEKKNCGHCSIKMEKIGQHRYRKCRKENALKGTYAKYPIIINVIV